MAFYNLSNQSSGAPALTGVAGSLIAVLDFLLVTTMGWTKPFSGTNLAAYKQPAGTNGFYLYVDDTGTTVARVKAWETMTSISAGTNDFPTAVQFAGGMYVTKSSAASAVARPWRFTSDGKLFHFIMDILGTTPAAWSQAVGGFTFGDFRSYKAGDAYNTIIIADVQTPYTSAPSYTGIIQYCQTSAFAAACYVARTYTQTGTSMPAGQNADYGTGGVGGTPSYASGLQPYPSPLHGGIDLTRFHVAEGQPRRGWIPGRWFWCHAVSSTAGVGPQSADTFAGATGTDLAGKTFEFYHANAQATNAAIILETSDWS